MVVGSSMGGAMAMNLATGDMPQVLVAAGWRAKLVNSMWRIIKTTREQNATKMVNSICGI
jgi:hypothetical protein